MSKQASAPRLFDSGIVIAATLDAFRKLDPRHLMHNPVIFVTEVVAALVTFLWIRELSTGVGAPFFSGQIALWLWFTVLFATFAEAVAEGRGKAQAASLRVTRSDTKAKRYLVADPYLRFWMAFIEPHIGARSQRTMHAELNAAGLHLERDFVLTEWGTTFARSAPSPMKGARIAVAVRRRI